MWCEVIIPTYNDRHALARCLAGLAAQDCGPQAFRVWVCVDGSTDDTLNWLTQHPAAFPFALQVLTHPDGQNHGRNLTRNLPLPHLQLPYTLLLDADMVPQADMLSAHWHMQQRLGPCLSQGHAQFVLRHRNLWAAYLSTRGRFRYAQDAPVPIHYTVTDNLCLPTDWYVGVGGQDPAMSRHYGGDDTELAWRLHLAYGATLFSNPAACAANAMAKPLRQVRRQHREFGAHNLRYLRHKHPDLRAAYRSRLLEAEGWRKALAHVLTHPVLQALVWPLQWVPARAVQRAVVRYLMGAAIWRGYHLGI